jgi:hypothetical protein
MKNKITQRRSPNKQRNLVAKELWTSGKYKQRVAVDKSKYNRKNSKK